MAPYWQIVFNAGNPFHTELTGWGDLETDFNFGYDSKNGEFCDLVKAGIIDPTKVVITALQDAVSIAILFLTTEAVLVEENEITINDIKDPANPLKIRT